MKIIEHHINQEEPQDCESCGEEWNARHIIKLELFKGFTIEFCLCDSCFDKMDSHIVQEVSSRQETPAQSQINAGKEASP